MKAIEKLKATVKKLRDPNEGCPWDQRQDHHSLTTCLVEETAEVLEAIDTENFPLLREELGDLLLQIIMHCQIAEESNQFDFEIVCQEIDKKLIRRHPHVFQNPSKKPSSESVIKKWEEIKANEKAQTGIVERGLFKRKPPQLSALLQAKAVVKQIDKEKINMIPVIIKEKRQRSSETIIAKKMYSLVEQCYKESLDPEGILRNYLIDLKSNIEKEIATRDLK